MRWKLLFLIIAFWVNTASVWALKIKDLSVAPYGDYLLLYAYLEELPWQDLREALRHGLGLSFTYQIEVYRIRRFLRDERVTVQELTRTVYYDPIKNVFFVQTVGALEAPFRAGSARQALAIASSLEGLPLLPLSRLSAQANYRLKVRAVVRKFTKTGWPKKIIKFLLFRGDTLETSWENLRFSL
ncbi:DUF4390 domain-containing protein [Thermosulfurimonas dismutans]|uniref:Putative proline rich signal peptide protein n=1 Tax=Thermosulfurimonas dismutans TaxID=999894 RepID=A0A179D4G2_9BACT|nr:DUF4390 domain-containing protein [Thermosulfurimonas dismutans]OAQ20947.1 putative proline rich signal peptide protein [Thermosulfurimonas dismutans]